jgi:toxin ParE1/3/4
MTSPKNVVLRKLAEQDVERAIDHYGAEGGVEFALRFVNALEAVIRHVASHPSSGSPGYATELDLPGLRSRRLKRFPHLIFYVEQEDHVDVWRVLHGSMDIPAWLQDDAPQPR